MNRLRAAIVASAVPALAGCATVMSGTTQKVWIVTDPPGADCTLTQTGMMIGRVNPTPGVVEARRGGDAIRVACVKAGFGDAESLNRPGLVS